MSQVQYLDIADFQSLGYLQEANRQFFHPLGLALEVVVGPCPACRGTGRRQVPEALGGAPVEQTCPDCRGGKIVQMGGIWDYRLDPEGILFAEPPDEDMIAFIKTEGEKRSGAREALLAPGRVVQEPQDEVGVAPKGDPA